MVGVIKEKEWLVYAEEADILNYALFNKKAGQWRRENPKKAKIGNMRDFADVNQLVVMANLESANGRMIKEDLPKGERLQKLREQASFELNSLIKLNKKVIKSKKKIDK